MNSPAILKIIIGLVIAFSMAFIKPGYHDGATFSVMLFGVLLTVIGFAEMFGIWNW